MYTSRFNHVPDREKDQQKLLVNFLSRSADLVDAEFADLVSKTLDETDLSDEERAYLFERGYAFSSRDEEDRILQEHLQHEASGSSSIYLVYLDTFRTAPSHLSQVAARIDQMEREGKDRPPSGLVLYYEDSSQPCFSSQELDALIESGLHLGLKTRLITAWETLAGFQPLFSTKRVEDVTIVGSLAEFGKTLAFPRDTEDCLHELVDSGKRVTVVVRLASAEDGHLRSLMNYFIRNGWCFADHFQCCLEPADNQACLLGHWYGTEMALPQEIFRAFQAHPQVEFCSMANWIGINNLYGLIWKGRLPSPSLHFCSASHGLTVFTRDGGVFPCVRLAKTADPTRPPKEIPFEAFRERNGMRLAGCRDCKYILSCGGGCTFKALTENNGKVCCPPIKELIDVSLDAYLDELLAKSEFVQQNQQGGAS